jgi:hypothetical protein
MSETTISSLVALAGVLMSVVVSLLVSLRQTRLETQKLREEYLRQYAGKLFEKRLEAYPVLSRAVVSVIQKVNLSGSLSVEDINKLSQALIEWDAQNAIFTSANAQQIIHRLHHLLSDLGKMESSNLQKVLNNSEPLGQVKQRLLGLILALKNDLGIYTVKSPSAIAGTKDPSSMAEIDKIAGVEIKRYKVDIPPDEQ